MIKNFIFCIVLSLAQITGSAQSFIYFGAGADFALFEDGALNYVINRYNAQYGPGESKPGKEALLVTEIKEPKFFIGPSLVVGAGLLKGKLPIELGWSAGYRKFSGEVFNNFTSSNLKHELKINSNWMHVRIGYNFLDTQFPVTLGILAGVSLGTFKQLAKNENLESVIGSQTESSGFNDISNDFLVGITAAINMQVTGNESPVGMILRPYYHYNFIQSDFAPLDEALNGAKSEGIDLNSNIGMYGIQLMLTGHIWPSPKKYKKKRGAIE